MSEAEKVKLSAAKQLRSALIPHTPITPEMVGWAACCGIAIPNAPGLEVDPSPIRQFLDALIMDLTAPRPAPGAPNERTDDA